MGHCELHRWHDYDTLQHTLPSILACFNAPQNVCFCNQPAASASARSASRGEDTLEHPSCASIVRLVTSTMIPAQEAGKLHSEEHARVSSIEMTLATVGGAYYANENMCTIIPVLGTVTQNVHH